MTALYHHITFNPVLDQMFGRLNQTKEMDHQLWHVGDPWQHFLRVRNANSFVC